MSPETIRKKAEMYGIELEAQTRRRQEALQAANVAAEAILQLTGARAACMALLTEMEDPAKEQPEVKDA